MARKPQIGVIGLGKFGYKFGITMLDLGHKMLGIDCEPENIQRAQKVFTQVFQADATRKQALEQMGITDMTHILVSVGESIAASTMISMYLKEMGVENVWVKAINEDHAKLLGKVGVDEVIIPEHMAAQQMADRIHMPGLIERLPFDSEMIIQEMTIDKFAGKTLRAIDLTNRFSVQVIAIKKNRDFSFKYIPKADDILNQDDKIVVIGSVKALAGIKA